MSSTYKYENNNTRSKCSDEDGDSDNGTISFPGLKRKPYQHYEQTFSAQHIHFYISEEIGEPHNYTDMVHRFNTAGPSDTIFIHLNTPGGQLDTGIQLINAMNNSQAKIVCILESTAYSLGTLILLSGDEIIVNDHAMVMFHNFRGGVIGKGNELTSQLDATIKWFAALAKKIYIPFLTEEEVTKIIKGEDLWMNSGEVRKRLERMMKSLNVEPEEKAKTKKNSRAPKTKVDVGM